MFNMYPYTDFHELNLDWLLKQIREINATLKNFIVMNTIKYADPFQWNITTQYESNTIVMEPNTGTAYISVQPVPAGISITNTDFWTPVFDLSQLFGNFNDNISFHNEYLNIVSTHVYPIGSWLIWKNNLYLVTQAISLGDALNPGVNIVRRSVEELVDALKTALEAAISDNSNKIAHIFDDITVNNEADNVTASASYSVDEWIIWNNDLYVVTAAITAGDTLTPGTNIDKKSLEDIITTLATTLGTAISNNTSEINNIKTQIAGIVKTYDSLADLEAADLTDGEKVCTVMNGCLVNYTVKTSAASNEYAIALDNGLVAVVDKDEVSVKGLIANMTADCSGIVNDLIAKGYSLFFAPGQYYANIIIPAGVSPTIRGCGQYTAIEPAANNPIITINDGYMTHIQDIRLQSMVHFDSWLNAAGIRINNASKCTFESIIIENTHEGVWSLGSCLWNTFRNVRVLGCHGIAYRFEAVTAGHQINNNNFIACEQTVCTSHGWYFYDANKLSWGNIMTGCSCEATSSAIGPYTGDTTKEGIALLNVHVVLNGCYIENIPGPSVLLNWYRCVVKNTSFVSIVNPIFNIGGTFDQAVFVDNNGYNVTGGLYTPGSGTLTHTEGNVGLPNS